MAGAMDGRQTRTVRQIVDGGGDSGNGDGGGNSNDGGGDAGNNADAAPPPPPPDGGGPPPKADQDERILDQLERAPTMQQETAKRQGGSRIRGMIDK